ncbi:hypothetical protein Tsubulata_000987, partial [Turnera subulata]
LNPRSRAPYSHSSLLQGHRRLSLAGWCTTRLCEQLIKMESHCGKLCELVSEQSDGAINQDVAIISKWKISHFNLPYFFIGVVLGMFITAVTIKWLFN